MKFLEAMQALKEGKHVIHKDWDEEERYLVYMPGMKSVWQITLSPSVNAGNHLFAIDDYFSEDWQIADFNKPKEEAIEC